MLENDSRCRRRGDAGGRDRRDNALRGWRRGCHRARAAAPGIGASMDPERETAMEPGARIAYDAGRIGGRQTTTTLRGTT